MKLIKLYIAFLLTCLSLTNVSGKDSFWKNIDPTFDKLTERMELWARFQKDSFRTEETIKQMYAISQQKNNKQLFARSLYWDKNLDMYGYQYNGKGHPDRKGTFIIRLNQIPV